MTDLKKKLEFLNGKTSGKTENTSVVSDKMSTRDRLEELVSKKLRNKFVSKKKSTPRNAEFHNDFELLNFSYPMNSVFGKVVLNGWKDISGELISMIFNESELTGIDPLKLLYFDTETTGLSGGTGTIPFMLGFGFIEHDSFEVRIFVLNNPGKEREFLDKVDEFLATLDISGVVTYNGKGFDYPLMETRYILNRKKFPLLEFPHLDYLYPARIIWKNTFESRKLGYLGDMLLNISREDDIDGSMIPQFYFEYLRTGDFAMMDKIVEHNALDIVGLFALLLLGCKYAIDLSITSDDGEMLGIAMLNERFGNLDIAVDMYRNLNKNCSREEILSKSVKKLASIKKKKKLFEEAAELWKILSSSGDKKALREISIYFEHKKKDFSGAIEFVRRGLELSDISIVQRKDFEKRLTRLEKKIKKIVSKD